MKRPWMAAVVAVALGVASNASADPPAAHVGVLERVVAVVGHRAIFLSELRARAKPFLKQVDKAIPQEGAQRAAAYQQVMVELLDKMIDDTLVAMAADRARVTVSNDDVDSALKTLADSQKLSIPALLEAARAQGLTEQDYRQELRRQLLEGKMLLRRYRADAKGGAPTTEAARNEAIERERTKWMSELRQATFIEKRL